MFWLKSVVCFCVFINVNINAARILAVFPAPSENHQKVFRSLTHELVRRGHENVVLTTHPAYQKEHAPENLTEINIYDSSFKVMKQRIYTRYGNKKDMVLQSIGLMGVYLKMFEKQTAFEEVRGIIEKKDNNFDLLLVEAWLRYALGFAHVVKAPVIAVSTFDAVVDNYYVMGAQPHPLLFPQATASRLNERSIFERITEYCIHFFTLILNKHIETDENIVVKRIFGDNIPPLSKIQRYIDMLFINLYRLWEGCRPMPLSVVHLGGIHQKPEKELPQDLKRHLDSSVHGVIYLSFGTNIDVSILPADKIQVIINVFSQLPYDVLWKWDQDELPGRTENIRISKWFPQADLLRHPKVKLFITHGGQQSTDETITAGVPVIGIPMASDQYYNVRKYEDHKIGKRIHLGDLEEVTLKSAIETVIGDKSYRENVSRLRTLVNDQPMSSLQRAVWWTEHVLRHRGARHLRPPAANLTWAEYYELRLVLAALAVAVAAMSLLIILLRKAVKLIWILFYVKIKRW